MNPSISQINDDAATVEDHQYPIDKRPVSCFTSNGYYGYSMIYPTENETSPAAPAINVNNNYNATTTILQLTANDVIETPIGEMMTEEEYDDHHHHHHHQPQQQQQQQMVLETRKRTLQNTYHCNNNELLKRTRFENGYVVPSEQLTMMENNDQKMDSNLDDVLDVEIITDNYFNMKPMNLSSSPPQTYQIENNNHHTHHIDEISTRCNMKFPIFD